METIEKEKPPSNEINFNKYDAGHISVRPIKTAITGEKKETRTHTYPAGTRKNTRGKARTFDTGEIRETDLKCQATRGNTHS